MPTYRIDTMNVELSKMVSDEVATYNLDGVLYTSAERLRALNEFLVEATAQTVTNNLLARPANCRHLITVQLHRTSTSAGDYFARRIPKEMYYEMTREPLSCPYTTSAADYGFCEQAYLKDIIDSAPSADIVDPTYWQQQTLERARKILLTINTNN